MNFIVKTKILDLENLGQTAQNKSQAKKLWEAGELLPRGWPSDLFHQLLGTFASIIQYVDVGDVNGEGKD